MQGVGYRLWADADRRRIGAARLGAQPADGTVEALAIGDAAAVAAMIEACRRGPAIARVGEVTVSEDADDGSAGFGARPTV